MAGRVMPTLTTDHNNVGLPSEMVIEWAIIYNTSKVILSITLLIMEQHMPSTIWYIISS